MSEKQVTILQHTRSCANLANRDESCTCGLNWRVDLQTEREMHAAWRKRAEQAEAAGIRQTARARELALKLDEGLALVVASPEGADIYLGDLITMGCEISDLLREVGGLPALSRS